MTAKILPMTKNDSGLRPVEFKVLVLPDTLDQVTAGGIIKPDQKHERDEMAVTTGVVAKQSAYAFGAWPDGAPKPGDRVVYAKYAGGTVDGNDGVQYRIMNDKDICAVFE